ncbi:FixH family protein [Leptospira sp. WS92.C1]
MALHKSMKQAFAWVWIAFIALISATVVTLRYANEGYTGPIEKEYYEKGLNYEKAILEQKKMLAEGYSYESDLFKNPHLKKGKNEISIRFQKSGVPIGEAEIRVQIERPATDIWNRSILLKENSKSKGLYQGLLEFPEDGLWIFSLQGKTKGKTLNKTIELKIR